jgi:CRISP-associated protein Cas1
VIKKTLYFGSPAHLSCKNEQLIIDFKEEQLALDFFVYEEDAEWVARYDSRRELNKTLPIEDIGIVILDHWGITISQYLISSLLENNTAIINCNKTHMPTGLVLNLEGNSLQQEKFRNQLEATEPLKKQLWQQTIQAKIKNQASVLNNRFIETGNMLQWAKDVKSGDAESHEARAAAYYWKAIFSDNIDFYRSRTGPSPNNLLNYGYAILRAITARSLAGSGLLPTLGIHHHNKYNAYALADDIMEPYRPFVDSLVCELTSFGTENEELTPKIKKQLLGIGSADIVIDSDKSPLMVGMQRTTASLARCFSGEQKRILYPALES